MFKHPLWIALRPWSFPVTVAPIVIGGVAASHPLMSENLHSFSWFHFFLALLGGLSVHALGNIVNTYWDFIKGVDKKEFSDDRALVDGSVTKKQAMSMIIVSFVLSIGVAVYFLVNMAYSPHRDAAVTNFFFLVASGIFLSYSYTGYPFHLKYRRLGDIIIFLCFGPLLVLGSYFIQTLSLSVHPLLFSIPVGLLTENILHVNNTRDIETDKRAKVFTLAQLLGFRGSYLLYLILIVISYLLLVFYRFYYQSYYFFLPLLSLPMVPSLLQDFAAAKFHDMCPRTAQLSTLYGILLALAIFLHGKTSY